MDLGDASGRRCPDAFREAAFNTPTVDAGDQGLKVKEIAEKLAANPGNISVWFSTTGKKLTTKVEPGRYAVKGAKPAVAAKLEVKAPAKAVASKKVRKKAKKAAKPARKGFKLKKAATKAA